jgi:hypothetical protein
MRRFFLALSIPCLAASCSSGPTSPTVEPVSEFVLAPGESASVSGTGLTVRFEAVVNDSRCPAGVLCITAGDAEIALTVRRAGHSADALALRTADGRNRAEVGEWTLSLTGLAPYPFTNHPIAPGEYRATLRVDPIAQPARP